MTFEMGFDVRRRAMLRGIVSLRGHQTLWITSDWARMFGLMPSSGKWTERISFVYIYLLVVAILTPSLVQTLGGLYAAEAKTSPELQITILQTTLPAFVALLSVVLVANPWRAWLLRLNFGDITYLAPSPFDRRVLSVWRYLEMVVAVPLLVLLPLILVAPMFGSIWAQDVIPNVLRALFAIGLWAAPMLALGWHISLQEYARTPLPSGIALLARLGVVVAAGVLLATKPVILLWPGRLLVLMAMGQAPWAWPLLIAFSLVGVAVVWRAAYHLSLTRASAGSDVFARIQQLGVMVFLDRQLLWSVLSEARASQGSAVGILPPASGIAVILARAALFYRRRIGLAFQLFLAGITFGLALVIWRPANITIMVITAILLSFLVPPWMAHLFRRDLAVPFMAQFTPQPLIQRLLMSSVVPTALLLAGLIPMLVGLGAWMPEWVWGIVPVFWVLCLLGHVEAVGRGSAVGDRNLFTVLLGSIGVLVVIWSAMTSGTTGIFALGPALAVGGGVSLALIYLAEFRHNGLRA